MYLQISLDVLTKRTTNAVQRGVIRGKNMTLDEIYFTGYLSSRKYVDYVIECFEDKEELQYQELRTFINKTFSI
jgi:hypothetical protein